MRYIYKLRDLHIQCHHHVEAGFTLLLHAHLLEWADSPVPAVAEHPVELEWQRRERLYRVIIDHFDKGQVSVTIYLKIRDGKIWGLCWKNVVTLYCNFACIKFHSNCMEGCIKLKLFWIKNCTIFIFYIFYICFLFQAFFQSGFFPISH